MTFLSGSGKHAVYGRSLHIVYQRKGVLLLPQALSMDSQNVVDLVDPKTLSEHDMFRLQARRAV